MVITKIINSEKLNGERELFIYLPPGYDENEDRDYPCLYMQDGQNLFSEIGDSPYGKWYVDTTADDLIENEKIEPLIVVGVANSSWRDYEYTPTYDESEECGGYADIYLEFITEELMPFINQNFRVIQEREYTSICGSSLGGLLSIYALMNYPDVFASCAALSPSIWWDNRAILDYMENWDYDVQNLKLWVDMGWYENEENEENEESEENSEENDDNEDEIFCGEDGGVEPIDPDALIEDGYTPGNVESIYDTRELYVILEEKGFVQGENFYYYEDPWGFHNEESWAGRMEMILKFLFPSTNES